MAKGQQLKRSIQDQILATFPNAFLYNDGKEIRICGTEEGVELQIKCVLTCAKENVVQGADQALPGEFPAPTNAPVTPERAEPVKPTEEEKKKVADILKLLSF